MNTMEWLTRLVAFDTTSRNSNLDLIDAVQDWFARHKIAVRITRDAKEQKANLFATLPAHDGRSDGGIILSGHTDVVPVDGQQWDTDPFSATLRGDRIFGRGTCDMKGFLAVALALVPELLGMKLPRPVHMAFSYDEEIGCRGAPLIIADLQQAGIHADACIVGEPTKMQPIVAHKGVQGFRCMVSGHAAHSSLTPQGCNAIEYAARLICFLRGMADEFRRQGPFDEHFDVPFTSVSTNMVKGGNAGNTIPAQCEFFFEFRNLPDVKPREVIARIHAYANELQHEMQREKSGTAIVIDQVAAVPAFESSEEAEMTRLARRVSGEKEIRKVAYGTEAGLFQQAHIPTIVCGPGNIEQAHRANEYVLVEQLRMCEEFLRAVVSENKSE